MKQEIKESDRNCKFKILIKFPTRGRINKFFQTLNLYYDTLTDLENVKFLATLDLDDTESNTENVKSMLKTYPKMNYVYGTSYSKIHAVNRDMEKVPEWDIVLLASDDMIPQVKGWDEIIREKMQEHYPDTDGVLFFNDGYQKDKLNTLCILGKKYYERFNYIYHPDYKSTWSDNEFMLVGNILGKQTYFPDVIIRHEHPDWGYGHMDGIHSQNFQNLNHDRNLFHERQRHNFYL